VLASRREDITKQLGHLSGVIDALAVPERTQPGDQRTTDQGPSDHDPSDRTTTERTPTEVPHQERNDHE
jgi:hypothetical protein